MKLLQKFKFYLILIGIILILSGTVYVLRNAIVRKDAKIERLTNNLENEMNENAVLRVFNFKESELKGEYRNERDSLAKLLEIRPKQIIRYVDRVIIQHDTTVKYIVTVQKSDTVWAFFDKGDCYEYKGEVILTDGLISVKKTDFLYLNKITDSYFWYRKFPIFGKKRYEVKTSATCGTTFTRDISISRK